MRHAAVLGRPVAHSLSPALHTAAYAALGLDGWRYHALTCAAGDLPPLLARLRGGDRWAGLSLTMPLKQPAAGLVDELHTALGAVNTVVFTAGGQLAGHNTDPDGIAAGLAELGAPTEEVTLLGAGGTARAVLAALAAAGTRSLTVRVREPARAGPLLALAGRLGLPAVLDRLGPPVTGTTISTLPAGDEHLAVDGPLLDVRYHPWPTALARGAASRGHRTVGGLTVLVGQAAGQVRLFTGLEPPVEAMRQAGLTALAARR